MVAASPHAASHAASHSASLGIEAVSHAFDLPGRVLPVLDAVSFAAEPGEFIALLGPSGCGKSTLLRLLAGLDAPRQGRVLVDGQAVTRPDPSRVLMFQDPTLYPWRTVRQNAALGPEARGTLRQDAARIDDALALVGLAEFAGAYPRQLSGGMAQRAALARALVNRPRLLLLDEPLGKLDSLTRLQMQDELTALWRREGFTAVLVTHDVEEALLLADRVLVFGPRPARLLADLPVATPRPRHRPRSRSDPSLVRQREEILSLLGLHEAA